MSHRAFSHPWKAWPLLSLLLALLLFLTGSAMSRAASFTPSLPLTPTCQQVTLPVSFGLLNLSHAQVVGTLCSDGPLQGRTVQVLVSGATYGPIYWDFPYQPEIYSYVRALTAAGYATFDLARLGIAPSTQPDALEVTAHAEASVLHQVIQALRQGRIGGVAFSKVIVVSHSLGSIITIDEAARYGDADGLIITGFLHNVGFNLALTILHFYPAQDDPRFAGVSLPSGYLTTEPGSRGVFYDLDDADPAVLQEDEATKETVTTGETVTGIPAEGVPPSLLIHVPVLLAVGQDDNLFCGLVGCAQVLQLEAAFYAPDTCLETFMLPDAGHSINLHLNAPLWFHAAIDWSNRRLGATTSTPATEPC